MKQFAQNVSILETCEKFVRNHGKSVNLPFWGNHFHAKLFLNKVEHHMHILCLLQLIMSLYNVFGDDMLAKLP